MARRSVQLRWCGAGTGTRVAMITEGTYPHARGGVSVWCDQVVRGLPGFAFHVVALTATGDEALAWPMPANVASVAALGLWAPGSRSPIVVRREDRARAEDAVRRLLVASLVDPAAAGPRQVAAVDDAWATLCAEPVSRLVPGLLSSARGPGLVLDAWQRAAARGAVPPGATMSLADAVTVATHLSHSLRPLALPVLDVDLYHAVSNGLAALPCLVAHHRRGTPFVISEHGVYLRERMLAPGVRDQPLAVRAVLNGFTRELVSTAYRHARIVAPGNVYNRSWEIRLGADPRRIVTTYNGVDAGGFPAAELEPEVPTLAFVGRIDPLKDLETLIRSLPLVLRAVPDAVLRIFGATPEGNEAYRDRCVALAGTLGIADRVRWEGHVPDISAAYASGSLVVLSSISEGFPYSVIEAMCCGRAVVATDVGGVREAVADTGIVVPPRDPTAFAQACVRLMLDEQRRADLGRRARERVLARFTVDIAVRAVREVYLTASRPADPRCEDPRPQGPRLQGAGPRDTRPGRAADRVARALGPLAADIPLRAWRGGQG